MTTSPNAPPPAATISLRMRLALVLVLGLVSSSTLHTRLLLAQPARQYHVTGRVVDAASGMPLARAEVALTASAAEQPQQRGRPTLPLALASVTTGDDGAFDFEHVPAGKYSLRGSRRGYLSSTYQQHGTFSTAIVTGEGLPTTGLLLKLLPGGVISGSVLDDYGDPVEQANVKLYRLADDGLGGIHSDRAEIADDLGNYEFAHLQPGTYFVSVTGRVWYSSPPRQPTEPGPAAPPSALNLDVIYPRGFYPDTTDSRAATPIPVKGVERLRIDMHLHAVPAVHLTYPFQRPENSAFNLPLRLSESVFGELDDSPALTNSFVSFSDPQRQQNVITLSVAPGQYELTMGDHTVSVNASSDTELDLQSGSGSVALTGKLGAAPGAELPDRVSVSLQPTHPGSPAANANTSHEGDFDFAEVRPGSYELTARAEGRPLAILQIAVQGAQLEGHVLTIGTEAVTLAATVAPASSTLTGFVRDGEHPASGVMVVLVPEHPGDHTLYRRDQSDSDGSFSLGQIAAGRYTLVAIRDGWDLDWAEPAVIDQYLARGQSVVVTGAAGNPRKLPVPLAAQPR